MGGCVQTKQIRSNRYQLIWFPCAIFVLVKPDSLDVLGPILAKYKIAQELNKILYVSFTTVVDYMWLLRAACECLSSISKRALLYLAAAVSDFYVPSDKMVCFSISTSPYVIAGS